MFSIPLFWSSEASSPDCSESGGATASYQTPGSRRIWACQSAWWLRSQPAGPGWAGSPLSPRARGFVLASRQARWSPQLRGRWRKKEDKLRWRRDRKNAKKLNLARAWVHRGLELVLSWVICSASKRHFFKTNADISFLQSCTSVLPSSSLKRFYSASEFQNQSTSLLLSWKRDSTGASCPLKTTEEDEEEILEATKAGCY